MDKKPITDDFKKAISLYGQGSYFDARAALESIVQKEKQNSEAIHLLGVTNYLLGKNEDAILYISHAISIDPKNESYYTNLGNAYQQIGDLNLAQSNFQKSLKLNPNNVEARYNLGNLHLAMQDVDTARVLYEQVLEVNNTHLDAKINLAVVLQRQGKQQEALNKLNEVLSINKNDIRALSNKGQILLNLKEYDDALVALQRVLKLNPNHYAAHNNLGILYNDRGDIGTATEHFAKALNSNLTNGEACGNLLMNLYKMCNYAYIDQILPRMDQITNLSLIKGIRPGETPYLNILRCDFEDLNYKVAKAWSDYIKNSSDVFSKFSYQKKSKEDKVINIGYLSCDFYDHATGHLIYRLFELHDRTKFRVFVYSYGPKIDDKYRNKFVRDSDVFLNIEHMDPLEAANKINNDNIDILIDLKGYTKNNRIQICAYRPAPIQISYLGFPGTTGADFFDYIIVDETICPPESQKNYSEKFIYMPHSYQITDNQQLISDNGYTRYDFNLPDDAFVMCCFNQAMKIELALFAVWINIMLRYPKVVLWLWSSNKITQGNLHAIAKANGVDESRIIFADKIKKAQHLKRLQLADLVLDTKTYNGHTTTTDALYAGIPVVAICGRHFASRVSASLLKAVDLQECISYDLDQYAYLINRFIVDHEFYLSVHEKLENALDSSHLFNTEQFVKDLEIRLENVFKKKLFDHCG